jgi:D-proline reductase (dithiol) PrdB
MKMSRKAVMTKLFSRIPLLGRLWARTAPIAESAGVPWTPMRKPLSSSRVCLVTTGGLHLKSDVPFNMEDPDGDPSFRAIPATTTRDDLTITHDYYDHADADRDFNIVMPLDRIRELVAAGHLGGLTPTHYSFMGHIDGPHVATLEREILPQLIVRLRSESPDFVFLTPT